MPYCLDCSFTPLSIGYGQRKTCFSPVSLWQRAYAWTALDLQQPFYCWLHTVWPRRATDLHNRCLHCVKTWYKTWYEFSQVKVILTRSFMNRKNNFDLTKLIVDPVSNLTWHNANNDKNPVPSYEISILSPSAKDKMRKFYLRSCAKQSWFKSDVSTRDDF